MCFALSVNRRIDRTHRMPYRTKTS